MSHSAATEVLKIDEILTETMQLCILEKGRLELYRLVRIMIARLGAVEGRGVRVVVPLNHRARRTYGSPCSGDPFKDRVIHAVVRRPRAYTQE